MTTPTFPTLYSRSHHGILLILSQSIEDGDQEEDFSRFRCRPFYAQELEVRKEGYEAAARSSIKRKANMTLSYGSLRWLGLVEGRSSRFKCCCPAKKVWSSLLVFADRGLFKDVYGTVITSKHRFVLSSHVFRTRNSTITPIVRRVYHPHGRLRKQRR